MNYRLIYIKIIHKRKYILPEGYGEKHHILPKCVGGSNKNDNIIKLTAREHFICHLLLTKIYKNEIYNYHKMLKAFMMMSVCHSSTTQDRYKASRKYEKFRQEFSEMQKLLVGDKNSQFDTIWISNPYTGENKKINKEENIPEYWLKGRNLRYVGCDYCNDLYLYKKNSRTKYCEKCSILWRNHQPYHIGRYNRSTSKRIKKEVPIYHRNCIMCNNNFDTKNENMKYCKSCSINISCSNAAKKLRKKVIDENGKIFNSLTEAAKYYNITVGAIRFRIINNKFKYVDK